MNAPGAAADRPTGFTLLALLLGWIAAAGVSEILSVPPVQWQRPVVDVGLKLISIVLCAVGAEALWKVRPWANRVALALAVVAWVSALASQAFDPGVIPGLLMLGAILWLVVRYVDTQLQQRFGSAVILRRRIPVPWRVP